MVSKARSPEPIAAGSPVPVLRLLGVLALRPVLILALGLTLTAANLIVYGGAPPVSTELPSVPLWVGLVAVIVAPLTIAAAEEAVYRGYAQPRFANRTGTVLAWAIVAFYRESDEFAQRKLGESFIIGFALGVPTLLVIGLLESFGGPHVNWMAAFVVMMTGWLIGSIVSGIRYR